MARHPGYLLVPRFWILLMLACGGDGREADFVSANGVEFFLGVTKRFTNSTEAAAVDDYLLKALDGLRMVYTVEGMKGCMKGVEVKVMPTVFPCTSGGMCQGEQGGMTLTVAASRCLGTSAYAHEMAHWFQTCIEGTVDFKHEDSEVWAVADKVLPCPD